MFKEGSQWDSNPLRSNLEHIVIFFSVCYFIIALHQRLSHSTHLSSPLGFLTKNCYAFLVAPSPDRFIALGLQYGGRGDGSKVFGN
jgi:hypothetical protein